MADFTDEKRLRDLVISVLPDERVAADLREVLAEGGYRIELDGSDVSVPTDTTLHIVARSSHTYEYQIGFGDHFRVLVAVGGVKDLAHGVPTPGVCFATMWYGPQADLTTVDFSSQMP